MQQLNKQPRYPREVAFLQEMKAKGINLIYEPRRFRLSNGTRYTPDFYDPESHTYYELISTRQRWHQAKAKLALFIEDYPHIRLEIIHEYRKQISKYSDHPIKRYRTKHSITAKELAERVEAQGITCDISYIYHLESGRARPSYTMAKALSVASNGEINIIELLEYSNAA